jgi:hypothetical protein
LIYDKLATESSVEHNYLLSTIDHADIQHGLEAGIPFPSTAQINSDNVIDEYHQEAHAHGKVLLHLGSFTRMPLKKIA